MENIVKKKKIQKPEIKQTAREKRKRKHTVPYKDNKKNSRDQSKKMKIKEN